MSNAKSIPGLPPCLVISDKEQLELAKEALKGDKEKEGQLFCSVVGIVIGSFCIPYGIDSSRWGDAVRAAYPRFKEGLERFKPERGTRFSVYIFRWLQRGFLEWLNTEPIGIRIPKDRAITLKEFKRFLRLKNELSDFPWKVSYASIQEFCESTGQDPAMILTLIMSQRVVSEERLQRLAVDRSPDSHGEALEVFPKDGPAGLYYRSVETAVFEEMMTEAIQEAVAALSPRERQVVEMRFGFNGYFPQSLRNIGLAIGIERYRHQYVGLIRDRALRKIEKFLSAEHPWALTLYNYYVML